MYKNVAGQHTFAVVIEASTGNPKTSGVDFYITKDDGVQAAADSSTHVGNGQWRIAFTQAETNADVMGLSWSGTDVVANGMTFYPVTKKVSDLNDAAAAPSAATVASQVRTELGTELGRIDATISSRNATTPPTVGAIRTELEGSGTKLSTIHAKLPDAYIADSITLHGLYNMVDNRLTANRAGYLDKLNVSGTLAHSDAANTYKASVSGLATSAALSAVDAKIDTIDGNVDDILTNTERVDALIEDSTGDQFTAKALSQVPSPSLSEGDIEDIAEATAAEVGSAVAAGVWSAETRSLTEKTGFSLETAPPTAAAIRGEIDSNSTQLAAIHAKTTNLPASPAAVGSEMEVGATSIANITGGTLAGAGNTIWSHGTRTLSTAPPTAAQIKTELEAEGSTLKAINDRLPEAPAEAGEYGNDLSTIAEGVADCIQLGRADIKLNTSTTPWQEEVYVSGTDTLIFAKKLYTVDLAPVTSMAAYAAYKQENAL